MSLRETVAKVFAKQSRKVPTKDAWQRANLSPDERKIADFERELQLREFDQKKADNRIGDLNKQREETARQHLKKDYKPDWATTFKDKMLIEREAVKALDFKNQQQRKEFEQKADRRLLIDAKEREAREAGNRPPPRNNDGDREVEKEDAPPLDRHSPIEMKERPHPHLEPEPVTESYIAQVSEAEALFDRDAGHGGEPSEAAPAEAEATRTGMSSEERAARIAANEAAAAQEAADTNDLDPGREM